MDKKSKLLTIGQFAALHGVNKKTLMWYDEIGLFRPATIHPENGYRRYSYQQSSVLETILLLRELDVPIGEIQAFMGHRSAASLEALLEEQIQELDRRLTHMKAVRKTLENHRDNMQTLLTINLSEISVIEKQEHHLVTVDIDPADSFDKQVDLITAETKKYQLHRLHDASYGTMIEVDSLRAGKFEDYSKLFIEIPFPIKKSGLHRESGGSCVRAFYQGPWEEIYLCYQKIFRYAQERGISLEGFSYETIINETVIDRAEDAVIQIEIPAIKKEATSHAADCDL